VNGRLRKFVVPLLVIALLVVGTDWGEASSIPDVHEPLPPPALEGEGKETGPQTQAAGVVHLFWHEAISRPAFLGTESVGPLAMGLSAEEGKDPVQMAQAFLRTHSAPLRIAGADTQWNPIRTEVDDLGNSHVFLEQTYDGLPVFAGEVAVHIDDGLVAAANGEYLPAIGVSTKPELPVGAAYKAAIDELGLDDFVLGSGELMIYNPALLDLGPSANHLAYRLIVGDEDSPDSRTVFVDAHTGKLLLHYTNLQTGRNRQVYDLNGSTSLPGTLVYNESGPVGSPPADAISAFNFTGDTYDYFFNTHGRDSFDGSGATMRASVRYGTTANAFWNGYQTTFGPGFATKDVVAHEWAHAVTQYSADLIYAYQSGALNEAMSDIFGTMIDRDDWLMGEDTPIGAIRSLSNPNAYGDPAKVSDPQFYCGDADYGGVHTNMTVPGHAAYLMAEGGSYNGHTITSIGRDRTERIFYRVLTVYLTSGSNFGDAYDALRSACNDLVSIDPDGIDFTNVHCQQVQEALDATEMDQPVCGGGSGTPDSYEDDDTAGDASTITVNGDAQSHNFHDAGDNDWVRFSATTGTNYVIETSNLGSTCDTYVYLYDTDGDTQITYNDDGGTGLASRIAWTASADGTYYVRIRHYSSSRYGSGTDYDLSVTGAGGSTGADDYEPDDSWGDTNLITVNGAAQTHNFHDAGDNDWVRFTATAGASYIIETTDLGSGCDTYMYLYNTDGTTEITYDDDGGTGLASHIEWTPSSGGTYYVRVRHYSSSHYGTNTNYDLRVTTGGVSGDDYEVDDTPGQAKVITVDGAAQTHNFHDAGDDDWVKFTATAGAGYVIETSNLGGRCDTYLYLYDTDTTTEVTHDDDSGTGLASRIAWTAPSDGTYYVRVRHYSSDRYGSDTDYDLSITGAETGSPPDSYEDDDGPGDASTITVNGSAQTHNFHDTGDNDWVKFSATLGTDYIIETSNLGSNCDTYVYLYDTDGTTEIARNDDGSTGLASRITWTAPADGTYYIRVRHYSGSRYGDGTDYDLTVTSTSTPGTADAYEDDDGPDDASTISSTQADHNFHDAGDTDWAKFSATAGTGYVIETLNLGSRCDTYLYLYDTDGTTEIAHDDDSGTGLASRIGWTAPANGTYYVRVHHDSSSTYGANTDYDLRVTAVGSGGGDGYEPDDASGQANTITVDDDAQTHNFHMPGDEDWVKFSATAGVAYTIQTLNLGPRSDTYVYLYDTDGSTEITHNDDGGGGLASRITWAAPANGTYYVRVRHYSSSRYGSDTNYDLQVLSSGSSGGDGYEPDNSYSDAVLIATTGVTQTHNFHYAGDNDWAKFSTASGSSYVIETANLGTGCDTYLYLYDTDGATEITHDDDAGTGLASRIAWTASITGTYYVRVRHYSSSAYGPDTNYDLSVTTAGSSGGGEDAYEPDDTYSLTSTITADGTAQSHNFHDAGDNDWVKFSSTAGTGYVIETFNLGSTCDTYVYLYDSDGSTEITHDDDGGIGLASRIEWTASISGTYYVRVRHYSGSRHGDGTNYDLRITTASSSTADGYEPDDASDQANAITTDGTAQTHNFHDAGDGDWVYFSATSGNTCIIETTNLGSRSDTYMYLYDTDGSTEITHNDDGGTGLASRIVWAVPAGGTYYVKVRHYFNSTYGANTDYDLRVTCSSSVEDGYEDDDDPGDASTITINGGAQSHNFHDAGDNDWMKFAATAGTSYVIETSNLGSTCDTYMYLYDTDGSTEITHNDDGGMGLASRIVWTAPATGDYYVRVRHYFSGYYGPDTNYDLHVTTASSLSAPAATVEFIVEAARLGDQVEATVYIHQAVSAIKVEVLVKSDYLDLAEATPLSVDGKPLGELVTADADRWEVTTAEDGRPSVWYTGKADWDGSETCPVLRLRWQLATPPPTGKLAVPFSLTTVDQNGQATATVVGLTVVMLDSGPKIANVQPASLSNDADTLISLQGSNFVDTPKAYLRAGSDSIPLAEVTFINSELVRATVPANVKPGTYKVLLVNPDESSTEYHGDITIEQPGMQVYLPLIMLHNRGGR